MNFFDRLPSVIRLKECSPNRSTVGRFGQRHDALRSLDPSCSGLSNNSRFLWRNCVAGPPAGAVRHPVPLRRQACWQRIQIRPRRHRPPFWATPATVGRKHDDKGCKGRGQTTRTTYVCTSILYSTAVSARRMRCNARWQCRSGDTRTRISPQSAPAFAGTNGRNAVVPCEKLARCNLQSSPTPGSTTRSWRPENWPPLRGNPLRHRNRRQQRLFALGRRIGHSERR